MPNEPTTLPVQELSELHRRIDERPVEKAALALWTDRGVEFHYFAPPEEVEPMRLFIAFAAMMGERLPELGGEHG